MTRIALAGYGSLSRGVESALVQNRDMELAAVFTRRPESVLPRRDVPVLPIDEAPAWADRVDVLVLCGGSFSDLPAQGPELAKHFNTVDSFDTHPEIPKYFAKMDRALKASGRLGLVSAGWDPGLLSLLRLYMSAFLPEGESYTFWGRGISQGHSNAVRQIEGVRGAVQYTVPIESAVERVRSGAMPTLSKAERHTRECFVALDDGANGARVEREIVTMPYYFADNETAVHFVTMEELERDHSDVSTSGLVYRGGRTGRGDAHRMEFSLKLESNPEFTGGILVACARAVHRMAREGRTGAMSLFDVPPALLAAKSAEELRGELL